VALLRCDFFSDVLGFSTGAMVILPQATRGQIGMGGERGAGRLPVLYLLHGLSDDETTWTRRSAIERHVAERGLAVVMPTVHRSFYTDQANGHRYWEFVSDELPEVMGSFFPLSDRREDTFAAGLSMGGYGALKLALRRPDRFAAAASLSGATDVNTPRRQLLPDWAQTFGSVERTRENGDDLFDLIARADPATLPALWAWCGVDDELLDENRRFRDACVDRGVALEYSESEGDHSWPWWDAGIQRVLDWLPRA
jgi:putative tributyrin esterase